MISKTIMIGLVALAFVAGSIMTGTMADAAKDPKPDKDAGIIAALTAIADAIIGIEPNVTVDPTPITINAPQGEKGDTGDTGAKGDKGDTGDAGQGVTVLPCDGCVDAQSIAPNSITTSKIVDQSIGTADIQRNSISGALITDGSLGFVDFAQNGCTTNQIMKWDGTAWVCSDFIATFANLKTYTLTSSDVIVPPGTRVGANSQQCDSNDLMISGGVGQRGTGTTMRIVSSSPNPGFNAWNGAMINTGSIDGAMIMKIHCLDSSAPFR